MPDESPRTYKRGLVGVTAPAPPSQGGWVILQGMDDEPRFSIRGNSVAMTRKQWISVAVAMAVAIVGLVVAVMVLPSVGIIVTSAALLWALMVIAFGQAPDDRT